MRVRIILSTMLCAAAMAASGLSAAPLDEAGTCRAYILVDEVTGATIMGPEDITIDRASGVVYVSAYDRRAVEREKKAGGPIATGGGIYRFPLPDGLPQGASIPVTGMTGEFAKTHDFHPHGFHFRPGNPGNPGEPAKLHVVNHVYELQGGKLVDNPTIERFRIAGGALVHEATIRSGPGEPAMCSPNDIWAKADGSFYVSNDHGACTGFGRAWEETFALKRSYLLYYDGQTFRKVVQKLRFANGVTGREDPASGETLIIVSETRGKKLRVFAEADLLAAENSGSKATPRDSIALEGSPDNLGWSEDGDLLVATIPNIISMATYMTGLLGKKKTASRTQRIPWTDGRPGNAEIVFEDDGSMISGATSMAEAGGLYFIGAAFDDNIAICAERVE